MSITDPSASGQDPFAGGSNNGDFYRNLMQFGLATMAAGAKPGATTLGALGQGGLAATDSARQNALARSQQQNLGSESASRNLQNQLQLMGLNMYRQHAGQPAMQIGPNGQIIQAPMDSSQQVAATSPSSSTQPQQQGPQESQGMTGPVWASTPGSTRINNTPQTNTYPVQGNNDPLRAPPGVNPQQWEQYLGASYMGSPAAPAMKDMMLAGPQAEAEATARARHPGVIEARSGGIAYAPDAGLTATGRVEGETSGGAAYITPPSITGPSGQPVSGTQPQDMAFNQPGAAQLPGMMQGAMPQGNPASYAGLPSGAVLTNIGPGANEQIKNEMEFHTNGEHGELKSYNASIGSLQNLTQLQSYMDTINAHQGDPNFLASGAGSQTRMELAKMANTTWSVMGGDPKHPPISDPGTVAAGEAAYKTANLLGMQLINSQFGASREAASVIQTGLKSVPNMENTPQGAQLLLHSAKEVSNNTIDRYTFKEWWSRPDGPHPGDLRGADVAFNQAFPPQLYAKRAISQDKPIDITGLNGPPRLLPGTVIRYGNQPPRVIPPPQGLPFQLPSINGQQQ